MIVYRIEREKYLQNTLSGIGASMVSGYRWNSFATRLVYTSESRALATLEVAVHLDLNEDLPTDRMYVEIEIPETLLMMEVRQEDLPEGWDSIPPEKTTQFIGDDFVIEAQTAVLKVPSCIVPSEFNYLINPIHPDTGIIKVINVSPMRFDKRLKGR